MCAVVWCRGVECNELELFLQYCLQLGETCSHDQWQHEVVLRYIWKSCDDVNDRHLHLKKKIKEALFFTGEEIV